ncbi:hypothetical protein PNK_p0135 (plasmid) [Candidatus Protochlamydia naegleriophila]|uniref:Uncharacterized protein n=1 Tax=Candidatus Protochlamydia naegleriophila TaxID=389348 RepID=A0A0U5K7M4_9BACT|nr:hypothetical protein [Candidatus Protochlamydia naegleriophila]CUI18187.1 hypothetical protein PNK_p0135 [Candidatus Protochlamydia naegleriophila]
MLLEDDPSLIEENRLKLLAEEERGKNRLKAYEMYQSLTKEEITYPESREIDISDYLDDHNLDTFRSTLLSVGESPIHLYMVEL